jgi:hypothetical protein
MKALISLKTPFLRMPRHARKQESRFEGGRTEPPRFHRESQSEPPDVGSYGWGRRAR